MRLLCGFEMQTIPFPMTYTEPLRLLTSIFSNFWPRGTGIFSITNRSKFSSRSTFESKVATAWSSSGQRISITWFTSVVTAKILLRKAKLSSTLPQITSLKTLMMHRFLSSLRSTMRLLTPWHKM